MKIVITPDLVFKKSKKTEKFYMKIYPENQVYQQTTNCKFVLPYENQEALSHRIKFFARKALWK